MSEIEVLNEAYYQAANALTTYRREHGFEPGVRVRGQWRDNPAITGVIPPYGDSWSRVGHECVPVLRDDGVLQPWAMSDLIIITEKCQGEYILGSPNMSEPVNLFLASRNGCRT